MTVEPALDLRFGDCLAVLRTLPDASVDAVVTDPPYGLADHKPAQVTAAVTAWAAGDRELVPSGRGFMGRDWDAFVPPPAVWDECLRVLKPGGHLVAFAGSRTYDLMGLSIRMAGFEIRDGLAWLYGSGFPKSLDVSKAIDKRPGVERHPEFAADLRTAMAAKGYTNTFDVAEKVVGRRTGAIANWQKYQFPEAKWWPALRDLLDMDEGKWGPVIAEAERAKIGERTTGRGTGRGDTAFIGDSDNRDVTVPATDAARQWSGWGTALKPAQEPMVLARKPLAGTVAGNVLVHGTGGLNVDACRTAATGRPLIVSKSETSTGVFGDGLNGSAHGGTTDAGRWPANVLLSHGEACADECQPGCPVAELDAQSGVTKSPSSTGRGAGGQNGAYSPIAAQGKVQGGASRFFPVFRYQAKAPGKERPKIDGQGHPTVKPLALMEWVVRLVTPVGGTVLDPFAGTGTTLEAARRQGFASIGVERWDLAYRLACQRLGLPDVLPEPVLDEPAPLAAGY